jgi:hypothetical protein
MTDWFNIRIKTEKPAFDAVRALIRAWPEHVADEIYFPALEQIAKNGRDYIRYIILESTTATGEARAAAGGGVPGRVDTGTMFDAVSYRIYKGNTSFSASVGWTQGTPGYAIFQELGTSRGIEGMNAIITAREYMLSEIRGMNGTGKVSSNSFGGFE